MTGVKHAVLKQPYAERNPGETAAMSVEERPSEEVRAPMAEPAPPARLRPLALAGAASMGAGAIHAAAIGVHSEHRSAVYAFTAAAVFQLAWGAIALVRSSRWLGAIGAVGNTALFGGWMLAKTTGISFVGGLEEAESIQLADGLAAVLAAVAVVAAVSAIQALAAPNLRPARILMSGAAAMAVAVLAVPGMAAAGSHAHSGADGHGAAGHDDTEVHAGDHAAGAGGAEHVEVSLPTKPYDPAKPLDFGGVPGVTETQQARAENLVAVSLLRLPRFADPAVAEAAGFRSIGDGLTGHEHYINRAYVDDDKILDPDYPESLVYQVDRATGTKKLAAAMYMLRNGDTLADVPDLGGALTQWHIHNNLCYTTGGQVRGLTRPDGTCTPPLVKGAEVPMIHVWIVPHRCGPFAALEGVAGGQPPPGEKTLCDHAHGSTS